MKLYTDTNLNGLYFEITLILVYDKYFFVPGSKP